MYFIFIFFRIYPYLDGIRVQISYPCLGGKKLFESNAGYLRAYENVFIHITRFVWSSEPQRAGKIYRENPSVGLAVDVGDIVFRRMINRRVPATCPAGNAINPRAGLEMTAMTVSRYCFKFDKDDKSSDSARRRPISYRRTRFRISTRTDENVFENNTPRSPAAIQLWSVVQRDEKRTNAYVPGDHRTAGETIKPEQATRAEVYECKIR